MNRALFNLVLYKYIKFCTKIVALYVLRALSRAVFSGGGVLTSVPTYSLSDKQTLTLSSTRDQSQLLTKAEIFDKKRFAFN